MPILEVGDDGVLHVPGEFLADARPHARFELDILGEAVLLRPVGAVRPFWQQATPAERADAFEHGPLCCRRKLRPSGRKPTPRGLYD